MGSSDHVFRATLIGAQTPERHVAQLAADPLFRAQSLPERPKLTVRVAGPLKDAGKTTFADVLARCQVRAAQMALDTTRLAESTAMHIAYAALAEAHILASSMEIHLVPAQSGTHGELVLTVVDQGPRDSRVCFPDYARWRMLCTTQSMGMAIEGGLIRMSREHRDGQTQGRP